MKNKGVLFLTQAGIIAAAYFALTWASRSLSLADGAIQFRLSEILTVLPVFTPAAVPGLAIGCFFANMGSFLGIWDMAIGSFASLLSALGTRYLRKMTVKGLPVIALLPPVLVNAVIIGFEIAYIFPDEAAPVGFGMAALFVGLGQLVVCYAFGLPFFLAVKKTGLFKKALGVRS